MKIFKLEGNYHSDDDQVRFGERGRLLDDFDYSYDTPDKQDDQSWDDFGQADDNRDDKNVQSIKISQYEYDIVDLRVESWIWTVLPGQVCILYINIYHIYYIIYLH